MKYAFLFLLIINLLVFGKNKLSAILYPEANKIGLIMLIATGLIIYFSKPLTLFIQLFFIFCIYSLTILFFLLKGAVVQKKINFSLIGSKSLKNFVSNSLIISLIFFIFYFLFFGTFDRFSRLLNSPSIDQYIINFFQLAGFRAYYCIASLIHCVTNPLSVPGDWVEQFKPYLYYMIDDLFNDKLSIIVPDPNSTLQLFKTNLLVIKPLGWFYFCLFDLGIIGFSFFAYFMLVDNFKFFYRGINKYDHFVILLFSLQITLILFPTTTSSAYVFFPILIISAIKQFE